MLSGGQGKSSYIQNPEQARTPRVGTTRTRSRAGTPAVAPAHQTDNNIMLVLLHHYWHRGVGNNLGCEQEYGV